MRITARFDRSSGVDRRDVVVWLCGVSLVAFESSVSPPVFAAESADFKLIVHPGNRIGKVSRQFLSGAFLKNVTVWSDGETIKPVDQHPRAAPRRPFSERVLGRSVAAVRSYWQQRIFSGRGVPPPELESDEAVLRFVLAHRGACGYVSASFDTKNARILTIE